MEVAAGRTPPGKCLQLFILLFLMDRRGQETSGAAFRMERFLWGRLKVSSVRSSASTKWGQLFVAASPSVGTAEKGLQLSLGSGVLQWMKAELVSVL